MVNVLLALSQGIIFVLAAYFMVRLVERKDRKSVAK